MKKKERETEYEREVYFGETEKKRERGKKYGGKEDGNREGERG